MIQIIDGGDATFDALMYGGVHPGTLQFLSSQFENPSPAITAAGQQFFDRAAAIFQQFNGAEALRFMKAAARGVRHAWQSDDIKPLSTIGMLQFAPLKMQRFVMAEPTIRQIYHQHGCDGYSDTYIDMHPNDIGEAHYDYRRAMNGLVIDLPDDAEYEWQATTYMDTLSDGDSDLSLEEQIDIQDTWAFLRAHIKSSKEDPTSIYCGAMEI